jgi:D,D-heptose 1,7-bisphosphate phosphatase
MLKAVFFDRDNTIIEDIPYNGDPRRVTLLPGAIEVMRYCRLLGYEIIIVTNQSGVGRGYITEKEMHAVNSKVVNLFYDEGIVINGIYNCIHAPEEKCTCRKPHSGLLLKAAEDFDISLEDSIMIGDKISDVLAGQNAGCKLNILISSTLDKYDNCVIVRNLDDVIKIIDS